MKSQCLQRQRSAGLICGKVVWIGQNCKTVLNSQRLAEFELIVVVLKSQNPAETEWFKTIRCSLHREAGGLQSPSGYLWNFSQEKSIHSEELVLEHIYSRYYKPKCMENGRVSKLHSKSRLKAYLRKRFVFDALSNWDIPCWQEI